MVTVDRRGATRLAIFFGPVVAAIHLTAAALGQDFDPFQSINWPSVPLESADQFAPSDDPFERPSVNVPTASSFPISPASRSPIRQLPPTGEYSVQPTAYGGQPAPDRAVPLLLSTPPATSSAFNTLPTPPNPNCGTPNERPLNQLSINVQLPAGELPADLAAACWQQLNSVAGPAAGARTWPLQTYVWDATGLAYRPLYFEEINLERYGYGCCDCLQPFASAAHFFGTVPALPYCMAADCPGECQYTLGYYRPGSCPPWRCHRPPLSARGGISEAGVLTGLIFLIP